MIGKSLNFMLFFYIFGVFIFTNVEGLSIATNIALLLLLLILVIKGFKNRLVGIENCLIIIPLVMILFASILWSKYQVEATIQFFSFLTASVGGLAIMLALMNGANPKVVFWAAFLGSGYLAFSAWQERTALMLSRVAGLAGNPNTLALTLIVAGIFLSSNKLSTSILPKIYAISLLVFSIYFTGSRKTMAVLLLIPVFWVIDILIKGLNRKTIKRIVLVIVATILTITFAGPFIWSSLSETDLFKRTLKGFEGTESSSSIRVTMIADGFNLWLEKPLLGYGINQYRFESGYGTYSHNNYIELLVSGGLLALFAYYSILVFLLFKALKLQGQNRILVFFSLMLIPIWELALVSYYEKYIWVLLGFCSWLVLSRETSHKAQCKRGLDGSFVEPGIVREVILPGTEGNT